MSSQKLKILVSGCAMGQNIRFNGGHKRSPFIVEDLAEYAEFTPLCPEIAMGLGTPREALRLVRGPNKTTLLKTADGKLDLTEKAQFTAAKLAENITHNIDGIILVGNSPSCGISNVKVYDHNNSPSPIGSGFFAQKIKETLPLVPITEAGRLTDGEERRHFLTQLFVIADFKACAHSIKELQLFHQKNKYLIMAHSPMHVGALGNIAANAKKASFELALSEYHKYLAEALKIKPTKGKIANALSHVYGYFKKNLTGDQKQNFIRLINQNEKIPLLENLRLVLELLAYENLKQNNHYIAGQTLFSPYPISLG